MLTPEERKAAADCADKYPPGYGFSYLALPGYLSKYSYELRVVEHLKMYPEAIRFG